MLQLLHFIKAAVIYLLLLFLFQPGEGDAIGTVDADLLITIVNEGSTTIRQSNFSILYPERATITGENTFLNIEDYVVGLINYQ